MKSQEGMHGCSTLSAAEGDADVRRRDSRSMQSQKPTRTFMDISSVCVCGDDRAHVDGCSWQLMRLTGGRAAVSVRLGRELLDVANGEPTDVESRAVPVGHDSSEISHGAVAGLGRAGNTGELGRQAQSAHSRARVSRTSVVCSFFVRHGLWPEEGCRLLSPTFPSVAHCPCRCLLYMFLMSAIVRVLCRSRLFVCVCVDMVLQS